MATQAPQQPPEHDDPQEVSLYAARQKIYPRSVNGFFSKCRWLMVWLTQLAFYVTPWLIWNQRQAVLFDLEARRFYLFGFLLYPQDLVYLTGLLVMAALSLFLFTALAGRLWCGYACPQTVYTEIFLWLEKFTEGDRAARMRRDEGPLSAEKVARKGSKHLLWGLFAFWTGFTFVGYFTPIREVAGLVLSATLGPWQLFWIVFYSLATYGNAGWMREQVCKYMCPYARFQSAMFDHDTMIVTYDTARGEPRGARGKKVDYKAKGLGACVDCTLCVQVCPTGIDIRKGLQYECIGCGACIDVCDEVMDKMGYQPGLIKYSTQNGLDKGWSNRQMLRRALRPRVLVYMAVLGLIAVAWSASLMLRTPLKVDVIRDRATLARMVEMGRIENIYRLQVMNATEARHQIVVTVEGLPGIEIASDNQLELLPAEVRSLTVRVQTPPNAATGGSHPIHFRVQASDTPSLAVDEKSVFLVPN